MTGGRTSLLKKVLELLNRMQETVKISKEINSNMQKRTEAELRENIGASPGKQAWGAL